MGAGGSAAARGGGGGEDAARPEGRGRRVREGSGSPLPPPIVRPRSGARSGLSGENIALHSANTLFNTLPQSLEVTRHNIDIV